MKGLKEKTIKTIVIVGLVVVFIIGTIIAGIVMFIKRDDIKGGFGYDLTPEAIMMGVKSNKNTFKVDDVNVELYYSLYENDEEGERRKYSYIQELQDQVVFGMYMSNINNSYDVLDLIDIYECEDYTKLSKETFIKEITEEEAFDTEYSYGYSHVFDRMLYKHHETINIPKEFFKKEEGFIVIRLVSFITPNERSDKYLAMKYAYIILNYEYIDENTVKLEFEDTSN
ncbi:MAG: hypothetical protein IKL73_04515 [Lachnospiraceae bacterium]|nr:hypothetical protein [Lachnospiraceae bacterium]